MQQNPFMPPPNGGCNGTLVDDPTHMRRANSIIYFIARVRREAQGAPVGPNDRQLCAAVTNDRSRQPHFGFSARDRLRCLAWLDFSTLHQIVAVVAGAEGAAGSPVGLRTSGRPIRVRNLRRQSDA
jgi:hypothetical protein